MLALAVWLIPVCVVATHGYWWKWCKKLHQFSRTLRVLWNLKPVEQGLSHLHVSPNGRHAHLKYLHEGQEYIVYLPFNMRLLRGSSKHVILVSCGKETNVTQEKGIPYLLTVRELADGDCGATVRVLDLVSEDTSMYTIEEVPLV